MIGGAFGELCELWDEAGRPETGWFYVDALNESPRRVAELLAGSIGLTLADLEARAALAQCQPEEVASG